MVARNRAPKQGAWQLFDWEGVPKTPRHTAPVGGRPKAKRIARIQVPGGIMAYQGPNLRDPWRFWLSTARGMTEISREEAERRLTRYGKIDPRDIPR